MICDRGKSSVPAKLKICKHNKTRSRNGGGLEFLTASRIGETLKQDEILVKNWSDKFPIMILVQKFVRQQKSGPLRIFAKVLLIG